MSPAAVVALNVAVWVTPVTSIKLLPSKPLMFIEAIVSRAQVGVVAAARV